MNDQNRNRIGELIRRAIQRGTDLAGDFLNRKRPDPNIVDMPQPPEVYTQNLGTKIAGILMAAAGFGTGVILLPCALIFLFGSALAGMFTVGLSLSVISLLLVGGCVFLGAKGISMVNSVNRFNTYQKTIGEDELCNIRQLADRIGKSQNFVVKDVEKMIRKGWFCQGHLDEQKTCLMVTDQMYREYKRIENEKAQHRLEEEERLKRQKKEAEQKKRQPARAPSESGLPPEVQKAIAQGDEYVRKIRQCNDAIPGEVISEKIDRMELLTNKIFSRVKQNPESVGDIRKLMEYYLPITIKLLETYAEMDTQPVGGQNIQSAKKEIEESLDTINAAFENLLDSLFQDTAWDVSSDISVLKTMLAQEGLNEDGFHTNKSDGGQD